MILVTGGRGFIGTALVARLVAQGETVRVFDNGSRASDSLIDSDQVQYFSGDIRDYKAVGGACWDCDEVIHLAYINGTKNFYSRPDEVLDVGVKGAINIVDACMERGVKKLTMASSSEVCRSMADGSEGVPLVIPDPYNPRYSYSAGKMITEMLAIHNSRMFERVQIFRPYNVYGPGMSPGHVVPDFFDQMRKIEDGGEFVMLGNGSETRSFCYIDDLIDGVMLMRAVCPSGIYHIGRPEETRIVDLAQMIAAVVGKRVRIKSQMGLREGEIKRRKPDISKMMEYGFRPRISLHTGLVKIWELEK